MAHCHLRALPVLVLNVGALAFSVTVCSVAQAPATTIAHNSGEAYLQNSEIPVPLWKPEKS